MIAEFMKAGKDVGKEPPSIVVLGNVTVATGGITIQLLVYLIVQSGHFSEPCISILSSQSLLLIIWMPREVA